MKNHIITRIIKDKQVLVAFPTSSDQFEELRENITNIHINQTGGLTVWIDINI